MVYLPYLQPFDDVNKGVSRLAANIPFLLTNLCPLSFTDVPQDLYRQVVLGVYKLRRVDLLRDVFLWAYRRSTKRYTVIQQSLGEPDPFRLKYQERIREFGANVIPRPSAPFFCASSCAKSGNQGVLWHGTGVQMPTCPGTMHETQGIWQGMSQQTWRTQ